MADPLSDAFGAGGGAPVEDMGALDELDEEIDATESDEALDAAIDEALTAEDPAIRREAFKTAVRLCKESDY